MLLRCCITNECTEAWRTSSATAERLVGKETMGRYRLSHLTACGVCRAVSRSRINTDWLIAWTHETSAVFYLRVKCVDDEAPVYCRFRPGHRHPLRDGLMTHLVSASWSPSSWSRHSQCDASGALACARRRNDVTRCNGIDVPPIWSAVCSWRHQ